MKSRSLILFALVWSLVSSQSTALHLSVPTASASRQAGQTLEGESISIKLVKASLVDFFRTISELSGLNILIDPDVAGSITINVEGVPWDQLFDTVLKSHQLERSIEGNLVRISTKETLRREEEAHQNSKRAEFLAADTVTITKRLDYADAQVVFESLNQDKAFLSERGELIVDQRTNTLFVTDVEENLNRLMDLLKAVDTPEPQVEIEARIIEVTTNFAREIGINFGFSMGDPQDRDRGSSRGFAPSNIPIIGSGSFGTGHLIDTFKLDAAIVAGQQDGRARILSKPRVSTQNNAEAIITQGARIPIPVQANFTTTVRFETAALRLTVTPQITEEDTVSLSIRLQNSIPDFTRTVLGIPTILTSEAETLVLVPDGGTTVIGGLLVETDRYSTNKVPVLGDIPIMGHLFKRKSKQRETREILFFLTPRIKR